MLGDDTGLLQQVGFDISTRQLASGAEVDTDELTLLGIKESQKPSEGESSRVAGRWRGGKREVGNIFSMNRMRERKQSEHNVTSSALS